MSNHPFSDEQVAAIKFSGAQIRTIVLAVVTGTPGITREKIVEFVEWCEGVRVDAALVDLILDGRLTVAHTSPGDFSVIVVDRDTEGNDQ